MALRSKRAATETRRETSTPIYCASEPPSHNCTSYTYSFYCSLIEPLLRHITHFPTFRKVLQTTNIPPTHTYFQCSLPGFLGMSALVWPQVQNNSQKAFFPVIRQLICFLGFFFTRSYVTGHLPAALVVPSAAILLLYDPEIRIPCLVQ